MIDYQASFVNTNGVAFPGTLAVNVSAPGAGDGTEFVKLMVDDIWGRAQALMDLAGIVPDGVTEAPGTAQIIEALCKGFGIGPGIGVTYWKNDTPVAHGDRVLLLQGQEIAIATYANLFAEVYCGDAANPTAPAFYATNGAGVRTLPGAGATHFVLPDGRGLPLKMLGNATINGRAKVGPTELGEQQEDRFQDWQVGSSSDSTGARNSWMRAFNRDVAMTTGASVNRTEVQSDTGAQGGVNKLKAMDDGTNGVPRVGANTRDSSLGTNHGITY